MGFNKLGRFGQVAALALAMLIGVWLGYFNTKRSIDQGYLSLAENMAAVSRSKLLQSLVLINSEYVDPVSIDSLTERVLPSLVKELDPHSVYIPAKELADLNEPLEGEFDGIGVVFNMSTDTVIVLNTIPSGPSFKAGVLAGDRIIKINDSIVAGQKIRQTDIMKQLRGKRGTEVKLSLERANVDDLVDVMVTRDAIPIHSVESKFMIAPKVGFIRLSRFARTSYSEVVEAIDTLQKQGMESLIFDLRDNSGGYLDQAILIADEFLHQDQLIVYTEDRNKEQIKQFASGNGRLQDLDVVMLINEGSASSSEILAGALQDNDRGTIVGRRSFGKGLVQNQIPFADGSALRLTIARYFTPTGRSIQKPYTMGKSSDYDEDLLQRYKNNEMFSIDSIHFADSLRKVTPKGKVVYGGGGIMPDIFVAADTTDVTKYYLEITARNTLYTFTLKYADQHRAELNKITTIDQINKFLDRDPQLVEKFIAYATKQGITPNRAQINRSRKIIEAQLRAIIARNSALEDNGFYANILPIDNTLQRAVEILEQGYGDNAQAEEPSIKPSEK